MTTRPLVIYHGNCADGFSAAWSVRFGLLAETGAAVVFHFERSNVPHERASPVPGASPLDAAG